jgi:hypothetical protein
MNKVRVYTMEYVPFVMGGSVYQPICTEVESAGEYDLGKGFTGYLIVAPNGRTFIAEKESGAFIGGTIDGVRNDITSCDDIQFMQKQVSDAVKYVKQARMVSPSEFWRKLKAVKAR